MVYRVAQWGQTDRQTDRQTHTHTHTHRERERETTDSRYSDSAHISWVGMMARAMGCTSRPQISLVVPSHKSLCY